MSEAQPVFFADGKRVVAADSETGLIQAGNLAPPLVCVSNAERRGEVLSTDLLLRDGGLRFYRRTLVDPANILVIHNAPFDLGVAVNEDPDLIVPVFDAYEAGRICCTIVLQKLLDVALGMRKFRWRETGEGGVVKSSYSLADLIHWYYGERVAKGEDTWRRSYALLADVSLDRWPEDAKHYAIEDAVLHLRLWKAEQRAMRERGEDLPNQLETQRAAFALHLISLWGLRADAKMVDKFVDHCRAEIEKMHRDLAGTGIFWPLYRCGTPKCGHESDEPWEICPKCGKEGRCRKSTKGGKRCMAEIRRRVVVDCERRQVAVPKTDPSDTYPEGQVQTDKEVLEETDDPDLHILATQLTFEKHLGQWGPVCRAAVLRPVCARYDPLVETGRTSCSGAEGQEGTNFQNPPRKGEVRPCFQPREGFLFCSTDADTIELRAHAQNCLEMVGWSKMAEALWDQHENGGPDLHLRLAAALLRVDPYEALRRKKEGDAEITEARQFVKIANFGFPGGLGAETMIAYAAGQLDRATHRKWFGEQREEQLSRAKALRDLWFETWPENKRYFEVVSEMISGGGRSEYGQRGTIRQRMSGRIRGEVGFTAGSNTFFQGRVADAAKDFLWQLANECYTGRCTAKHRHGESALCTVNGRSVLHGSRTVLFLHDEGVLEHPEDGTESDRAERQQQIMVECLSRWMPDIPCTSSAVLTRRWWKGAEPLKVNGRLVPVRPEKVEVDGKVKVRWIEDRRAA